MASSSMIFEGHAPQATFSAHWHWRRVWLPVMAFSLVFAVESTPYFGGDHTSEPLRRVAEALLGYDACVNWEMMHHLIRKAGHFAGYGLFSLICFRAFWTTLGGAACRMPRQLGAHGLAILLTFLVAGADEFHQSFLPNRTGQFSDVVLDTCGGVALCFVLFLGMQAVAWSKRARALPVQQRSLSAAIR
ncbi:MAG TPA: VanZ family protein [Terracidiphilus sp.]